MGGAVNGKDISVIPKIEGGGFYTFEEVMDYYIKLQFLKEISSETTEEKVEDINDCTKYRITNQPKSSGCSRNKLYF